MLDVLGKMRECGKYIKMRDFPNDCGMVDTYAMFMVRTPKQRLSPEGRLCRDCLFLDAINAVPRFPSPKCALAFSRVI